MTMHPTPDRRGAALLAAIGALAVIAALILGTHFTIVRDARDSDAAVAQLRARHATESGLALAVARWDGRRNVRMADGEVALLAAPLAGATIRITRLGRFHFQVESEAAHAAGPRLAARRHSALAVRLHVPEPTTLAAFTAAGTIAIGPRASVSGLDSAPPAWDDCPAPTGDVPAVAAIADASVSVDEGGVLTGAGTVLATAAAAAGATHASFGEASWASLTRDADVRTTGLAPRSPAPAAAATDCVVGAERWGEPARGFGAVPECGDAFPVISVAHARPLLVRGPARGQGILLVDGDLEVEGDFEFDGLVIVRDDVVVRSGALRVRGLVLAANDDADDGSILGGRSRVTYSSCALQRALLGAARAQPLARRARTTVWR